MKYDFTAARRDSGTGGGAVELPRSAGAAAACVNADVAVGDGKWELRGVGDSAGKLLPTFEGLFTLVVQRTGGWQIEAYRYTQKPAAAPMPTLLKRPGFPGGPG